MDETPIWADMVAETTVEQCGIKTVLMKSTGHEKCRVSVSLLAKADDTKLKPMIVFKCGKRETEALSKEFGKQCVIASSSNVWVNTDLTLKWVPSVLGMFSFDMIRKSFLACGLSKAIDNSEDDEIHCFKEGETCSNGRDYWNSNWK